MSLDVGCLREVQAGFAVAFPDEALLCLVTGRGDGRRFAILVQCRLTDDGSDGVVVLQSVWEPLQDD